MKSRRNSETVRFLLERRFTHRGGWDIEPSTDTQGTVGGVDSPERAVEGSNEADRVADLRFDFYGGWLLELEGVLVHGAFSAVGVVGVELPGALGCRGRWREEAESGKRRSVRNGGPEQGGEAGSRHERLRSPEFFGPLAGYFCLRKSRWLSSPIKRLKTVSGSHQLSGPNINHGPN